jgi:hypothetical protein
VERGNVCPRDVHVSLQIVVNNASIRFKLHAWQFSEPLDDSAGRRPVTTAIITIVIVIPYPHQRDDHRDRR